MKVEIIVVIVFDGLVDLDVVFQLGNDGLDLAGVLLGVGFLERHQFFRLHGLRRIGGGGQRRRRRVQHRHGAARGGATGAIGTTSPV